MKRNINNSRSTTIETILVQMRLQPKTMERIENLTELTGITNRAQLVATSIELAEELIKNKEEGGKIYIEKDDGTRLKMVLKY